MTKDQEKLFNPQAQDYTRQAIISAAGGNGPRKKLAKRKLEKTGLVNAHCFVANSKPRLKMLESTMRLATSISEMKNFKEKKAKDKLEQKKIKQVETIRKRDEKAQEFQHQKTKLQTVCAPTALKKLHESRRLTKEDMQAIAESWFPPADATSLRLPNSMKVGKEGTGDMIDNFAALLESEAGQAKMAQLRANGPPSPPAPLVEITAQPMPITMISKDPGEAVQEAVAAKQVSAVVPLPTTPVPVPLAASTPHPVPVLAKVPDAHVELPNDKGVSSLQQGDLCCVVDDVTATLVVFVHIGEIILQPNKNNGQFKVDFYSGKYKSSKQQCYQPLDYWYGFITPHFV